MGGNLSGQAKAALRYWSAARTIEGMGWLMGLEPTTTGITIQDSTN